MPVSTYPQPQKDIFRLGFDMQHRRTYHERSGQLHHHDFYEIYLLISGAVTYTVEGQPIPLHPGDILLISPQQLHQVLLPPDSGAYERYVLWLRPGLLRQLSQEGTDLEQALRSDLPDHHELLNTTPQEFALIRTLMETLHREQRQAEVFGASLLCTSLLTQLLVLLNRLSRQLPQVYSPADTISQVVDYIHRHCKEPLTLDSLSEKFHLSKHHLSHAFKAQVGTSVYRYIQKKRLQLAKELMAAGAKPSRVFETCGFQEYVSFYRAFRKEYGTSPTDYFREAGQR